MKKRRLGKTSWEISEVGFGAWAIGSTWGSVDDSESASALHAAADAGVTFFDTADVYGDGRSERLIADLLRDRPDLKVATKAGRRLNPHSADGYTYDNLAGFVDRSLANLGVDRIDLLQLHCPPTDAYYRAEPFEALERLMADGKIAHWGVSVERVEEALKAIEHPACASVQIIFNAFRHRPRELFFEQARKRDVGIVVRLPLSSGMLSGKMRADTSFEADDHRSFNREGAAFDKGETFSGVPFDVGLAAVEDLRGLVPPGATMAQFALRWILDHPDVTTVIPGAKRSDQAIDNAAASDLASLPAETHAEIDRIYDERIRPHVHHLW